MRKPPFKSGQPEKSSTGRTRPGKSRTRQPRNPGETFQKPGGFKRRKPFAEREAEGSATEVFPMRLNKFIAHAGICSRRQAVEEIKAGNVSIQGEVVLEPYRLIQKEDQVTYKGKEVKLEGKKIYLLMNKPKDVITTAKDEKGRKTILDLLDPGIRERVYPVGRLDRETTGLILLTNDGDLAAQLAHPSYGVQKIYHVTLSEPLAGQDLEKIRKGLTLSDGFFAPDSIEYVEGSGKKEVGIEIHSGRNRIIRRLFEELEYRVEKLDRVYYAGLTKKDIPRGKYRYLSRQEVIMLKHFSRKKG